ncbi:hypothetical protein SK128_001605 [Halocaridina rubra]|uniref:Uncharacterized protein n=1 Tax=Halocaridina rubra TaxID=373956 RepID=A0AAN8X3P2_HALRR
MPAQLGAGPNSRSMERGIGYIPFRSITNVSLARQLDDVTRFSMETVHQRLERPSGVS